MFVWFLLEINFSDYYFQSLTPEEDDEGGATGETPSGSDSKQESQKVDKMELLKQRRLQKKKDRQTKDGKEAITEEAQK